MFPTFSKVTMVLCVAMMMMMATVTKAAAVPKAGGQSKHSGKAAGHAVETVPLHLNPNDLVPTTHIRALQNVSISPWAYNVSNDDSRFPHSLSEARCMLSGCLDSEGREDLSLKSRPIMHQVLLLRRVRSTGEGQGYHYRLESRVIAVGCTCVRPVVHQQH